jgi:hypothetical protein
VTVPCRTLIVDDDDDMAFLITTTIQLANHGLSVAGVASSGEEALGLLAETEADVIVLDYRMPGRNGLEVAGDIPEPEDRPLQRPPRRRNDRRRGSDRRAGVPLQVEPAGSPRGGSQALPRRLTVVDASGTPC